MKTKGVLDQKYIYLFCCNFIPPFIFFFLFFWWASLAVSAEIASGHKLTAWGPDIFAHRCKWLVSECRYKYGCRYRCRCRYRCIEGRRTQTNAKRDKHTQNHLKSTMMTLMSVPTPLNPLISPFLAPTEKDTPVEFSSAGLALRLILVSSSLMTQKYTKKSSKKKELKTGNVHDLTQKPTTKATATSTAAATHQRGKRLHPKAKNAQFDCTKIKSKWRTATTTTTPTELNRWTQK